MHLEKVKVCSTINCNCRKVCRLLRKIQIPSLIPRQMIEFTCLLCIVPLLFVAEDPVTFKDRAPIHKRYLLMNNTHIHATMAHITLTIITTLLSIQR